MVVYLLKKIAILETFSKGMLIHLINFRIRKFGRFGTDCPLHSTSSTRHFGLLFRLIDSHKGCQQH